MKPDNNLPVRLLGI